MQNRNLYRTLILFFLVSAVFLAVRSTQGLVWNDSPQTAENLYGFEHGFAKSSTEAPLCRDEGAYGLRWSTPGLLKTVFARAFSCMEFGGYRPLSAALSFTGVAVFSDAYAPSQPNELPAKVWTVAVAFLFGLLAVLLFSIARECVRTDLAGYAVLFLFFFSPPVLSGAWILFSGGIQVTVPLFICLGLWLYRRCAEAKQEHRWRWESLLALVFIAGPWVREYIGIVPILIMFLELQEHRRPTRLFALSMIGLLHALFPTALLQAVLPNLPLVPVFKLGSLASALGIVSDGQPSLGAMLSSVKWEAAKIFLVVLPPSFFLLSGLIVLSTWCRDIRSAAAIVGLATILLFWANKAWFWFALILAFCGLTLLLALREHAIQPDGRLRRTVFLNVWFLLSFLPFFKVLTAHVHLAYPLIPAAILVVASTERFWLNVLNRIAAVWKKAIMAPVLAVCVSDHALNLYGSYATVEALYGAIRAVAGWMRVNTPPGTIVVANALHVEDVRLYSQNHISPYWTVNAGVPGERTLEQPVELERFLQDNLDSRRILMLEMDREYSVTKGSYHAHKYITRKTVHVGPRYRIHAMARWFPFADPLRHLLSADLVLFLGPPDLENDIYSGRDRSRRLFLNEVSVEHDAYTLLGSRVSRWAHCMPDSTFLYPTCLASYRGYRLCGYRDRMLAVPDGISLDETQRDPAIHPAILASPSVSELKALIDERSSGAGPTNTPPELGPAGRALHHCLE